MTLTLTNYVQGNATLIENEFIDRYMPDANGEFVKVYLLLLRCKADPNRDISIAHIADTLNLTENDVIRALNYWKKQGLLEYDEGGAAPEGSAAGSAKGSFSGGVIRSIAARDVVQEKELLSEKGRAELREIKHVAECYLGKTLTKTEADAIIYFYDTLKMSAELIEYLFEYCVERGHKSIHYIKTVAFGWVKDGIQDIEQAKAASGRFKKEYYTVLNAFGITGRAPAPAEIEYIRRWQDEYGFSMELIEEACNRTMSAIHQPNFGYTESILARWKENGVRTKEDVIALDVIHMKNKDTKKQTAGKTAAGKKTAGGKTKFSNFTGRDYENMSELERKLIEN